MLRASLRLSQSHIRVDLPGGGCVFVGFTYIIRAIALVNLAVGRSGPQRFRQRGGFPLLAVSRFYLRIAEGNCSFSFPHEELSHLREGSSWRVSVKTKNAQGGELDPHYTGAP